MNEKQKKPKRKQITVSPETKAKIDRALGQYIARNGYISHGAFCDMFISDCLDWFPQDAPGSTVQIVPIPGNPSSEPIDENQKWFAAARASLRTSQDE